MHSHHQHHSQGKVVASSSSTSPSSGSVSSSSATSAAPPTSTAHPPSSYITPGGPSNYFHAVPFIDHHHTHQSALQPFSSFATPGAQSSSANNPYGQSEFHYTLHKLSIFWWHHITSLFYFVTDQYAGYGPSSPTASGSGGQSFVEQYAAYNQNAAAAAAAANSTSASSHGNYHISMSNAATVAASTVTSGSSAVAGGYSTSPYNSHSNTMAQQAAAHQSPPSVATSGTTGSGSLYQTESYLNLCLKSQQDPSTSGAASDPYSPPLPPNKKVKKSGRGRGRTRAVNPSPSPDTIIDRIFIWYIDETVLLHLTLAEFSRFGTFNVSLKTFHLYNNFINCFSFALSLGPYVSTGDGRAKSLYQ